MNAGLNVLSLFDGMSCGRIALERAGIKVANYYASEVDKYAITVSKANWEDIIHIGDVTKVNYKDGVLYTEKGDFEVGKIDLIIGGSPCQSISKCGDGTGLEGKSKLFYEYLRILNEVKPVNFLLENVVGKKEAIEKITNLVGVKPIMINSSLVSAQNRRRYYWTDIEYLTQPEDLKLIINSILEYPIENTETGFDPTSTNQINPCKKSGGRQPYQQNRVFHVNGKVHALTATLASRTNVGLSDKSTWRKLTVKECERLQNVPDCYTSSVSAAQGYKMLGNGWTVDVIVHILKGIKEPEIIKFEDEVSFT